MSDELSNEEYAKSFIKGLRESVTWKSRKHFLSEFDNYRVKVKGIENVTINDLNDFRRRINPTKRHAIRSFLRHVGWEVSTDGLKRLGVVGDVDPDVFDDWILIYDLDKRVEADNEERLERALYFVHLEISHAETLSGYKGYYKTYRNGKIDEQGELMTDPPQSDPLTIAVSPALNRGYPNPKFYLKVISETRKFLIGIGIGFNDLYRNELIAVRVLGLPESALKSFDLKRDFMKESDFRGREFKFNKINEILHGESDHDKSGRLTIREKREENKKKKVSPYLEDVLVLYQDLE